MTREEWEASIIAKYGSVANYKLKAQAWGQKGGQTGGNGLTQLSHEQRVQAGKLGYAARVKKLKDELRAELENDQNPTE